MSWSINNLTAPDNYTPASTLDNLPAVSRVTLDIANGAIYYQLREIRVGGAGRTERMADTWGQETLVTPQSKPLHRRGIVGVRFRAAIAAAQLPAGQLQAQVTVQAIG